MDNVEPLKAIKEVMAKMYSNMKADQEERKAEIKVMQEEKKAQRTSLISWIEVEVTVRSSRSFKALSFPGWMPG
jgi:hypothetical protein